MKKFRNLLVLLLVICSVLFTNNAIAKQMLEYHALSVGHGDCTVFKMPDGHVMVIDAGEKYASGHIVSYLKSIGVKTIDLFVASHPHSDHIGGATELFKNFRVKNVWDSGFAREKSLIQKHYLETVAKSGASFKRVKAGEVATLGDAKLEVLAPVELITGTRSDANNNSIIILVTYKNVTFLMTGDAEKEEQAMLKFPHVNVLKAPHHGSKNGNYDELYAQTKPDIVTISYDKQSSYKLPHNKTRKLLLKYNPIRLGTADGDIVIKTDGTNIEYPANRAVKTVLKEKKDI